MRLLFLKPTLIGDCSYDAGTMADVDVPENVLRDNLLPSGSCRVATGGDAEPEKPVPKRETAAQKKARLAAEKAAAEKASEDATDTDAQESDEPDADDSADA